MRDVPKPTKAGRGRRIAKWGLYLVANAVIGFFLQRAILASGILTSYADATGGWVAQNLNVVAWTTAAIVSLIITGLLMFAIGSANTGGRAKKETPAEPAIKVHPYLFADEARVQDERGVEIRDQRLVTLCLQVSNALGTGDVIRNLHAILIQPSGARYRLRIRGSSTGVVDVKDGDLVFVEAAQILSAPGRAPAGLSGPVRVNEDALTTRAFHGFGAVKALVPSANDEAGLLAYVNFGTAGKLAVVLSADDVRSQTVWLQANFFVPKGFGWLRPIIRTASGYRMAED